MTDPIQPIVPEGTPLPPAPVGVPPYPITPLAVWTWSSPVIPEFYWNVYSSEQRIKSICKEIGKIESYLNYLVNETNKNIIELHQRIDQLTERVAALEKKVEEEVARLDALIAQLRADLEQEIADREAADTALGERIDQEILDRTHGDQTLHQEISDEATARTHADDALHDEISQETQDRIHADDQLHEEISHRLLPTDVQAGAEIEITRPDPNSNTIVIASTVAHSISELASTVSGLQAALTAETEERRADDQNLWKAVNQRIERGKILAGDGIEVVNDPDSSTVTISATGTGGSTTIEAGEGIKVETEGDSTTVSLATPYPSVEGSSPVTVQASSASAPGGEQTGTKYTVGVSAATENEAGVISEARVKELASGGGTTVRGQDPIDVRGTAQDGYSVRLNYDPNAFKLNGEYLTLKLASSSSLGVNTSTSGNPGLYVNKATKTSNGVISEDRVRELAGGVAPSLSAEAPLKLEDGSISLTKDPAGPVTSSSAGLSVREITPETESEEETGVVSKATIKSLFKPFDGGVDPEGGLETTVDGLLSVKFGSSPWQNNLGVGSSGELTLVGRSTALHAESKTIAEPVGQPTPTTDWYPGFWLGKPYFIQDTTQPNDPSKAEFILSSGVFEVQEVGSTAWKPAELGTFELVTYPDRLREEGAAAGYPQYHSLYARITPYGQSFYTPSTTEEEGGREKIQGLRVHYAYYNIYVLPSEDHTEEGE